MRFFFITNSPQMAVYVSRHGVDRIFVDLEILGKKQRQGHLNTVISEHSIADLRAVRSAVPGTELMARLNPLNPQTATEIENALDAGADILMLPMFRGKRDVEEFSELVAGRARVSLLAETREAMESVSDWVSVPGIDEVHVGLNDLSLDLGLPFMFQPLALGLVDTMAAEIRRVGKPFGIGGVARVNEGLLPAQIILGDHVRLGSTAAILSRTFHRGAKTVAEIENEMNFGAELAKLRSAYEEHCKASDDLLSKNRAELVRCVDDIVNGLTGPAKRQLKD